MLAVAGSPSMAASKKPAEDIRGQTINVLVPYRIPPAVISSFTKATGVKVNYVVTGWDATHTKLVVANTARTYIADVAEFDWSFTGQFAGAKWVEPLESYLPKPLLADLASTGAAFKSGGKTYAACFSNDFRISIYNKKMFAKAGIKTFPRTLTELGQAADKLKAAGVQYPLSIPMAATEGGVTPWYLLTLAQRRQPLRQELQADVPEARLGRLQGAAVGGAGRQEGLGLARRRVARRRHRLRQVHRRPDRDRARDRPGQPRDRERQVAVEHRRVRPWPRSCPG